jgi:O-antigen/teichoic acid export membrane protein
MSSWIRGNSLSKRLAPSDHNFVGIGSRGVSLVGKFLLVMYLTRYLSLTELGMYGVFSTTVLLAIYLIGAEYYTYSTRELLAVESERRPKLIRDQAVFHVLIYALVLPMLIIVFLLDFLPFSLIVSFYIILVLTHVSQEIHRILIALSHASAAYLISALANGVWTIPAIAGGLLFPQLRTLQFVLASWAFSVCLSVILGLFILWRWKLLQLSLEGINWQWIWKGLGISYKFLVASMAYRIIDSSDRYFIQYFFGESTVGIYTLYASISKILHDLVFAGSIAVIFPLLVNSFQQHDLEQYRYHLGRLKKAVIASSLFLTPFFVVGIYLMLRFLGRQELYVELAAYFILLLSSIIINLSVVPHYVLYARRKDNQILISTLFGALLNIILNLLWIPPYGLFGAALATTLSFAFVGLAKLYYVQRGSVEHEISPKS